MAHIASEFVEVFGEPSVSYAHLASEFVEVFGEPSVSYAHLASEFVEVFGVPSSTPTLYGVWPQEQLAINPNLQGGRLQIRRGQL